jgi:hypothetical protein
VCAGLHRRHVADVGTPSGRVDAALEALARAAPFRVPPARSGLELVEADRRSRGEHERAVAVGRAGADEIANGVLDDVADTEHLLAALVAVPDASAWA